MKKQKFAILDAEETYASNLMEYLSERQSIPFDTFVFVSLEELRAYTDQNPLDLLLVSDRMMCDEIRQMDIRRVIVLSDGEVLQEYGDYPLVYKYQSSESLVSEVMSCYARQQTAQPVFLAKKSVSVRAVYSPIGRCGKTSFALTLGQVLARRQSVLYINLEDYAGFSALLGHQALTDITDILYFLRQNRGSVIVKLNAAVQKMGAMDYLPPAQSPLDLREIRPEEWERLLEEITSYSSYETVILDIGNTVSDVFSLLAQCSRIYMPVCADRVSRAKVEQYEQLLKEMEYTEILERTQELVLPACAMPAGGEYLAEQLAAGEMGDYVRKLLRREAGYDPETGGI